MADEITTWQVQAAIALAGATYYTLDRLCCGSTPWQYHLKNQHCKALKVYSKLAFERSNGKWVILRLAGMDAAVCDM